MIRFVRCFVAKHVVCNCIHGRLVIRQNVKGVPDVHGRNVIGGGLTHAM